MASVASVPLIMPFSPESLAPELRQSYASTLWRAELDPFVFACNARHIGYALGGSWDVPAGMPELTAFSPPYPASRNTD